MPIYPFSYREQDTLDRSSIHRRVNMNRQPLMLTSDQLRNANLPNPWMPLDCWRKSEYLGRTLVNMERTCKVNTQRLRLIQTQNPLPL